MENSNSNPLSSSSSGRVGSPTDVGGGSENLDEAPDEEPSSSSKLHRAETELDNFRLQWKREIDLPPNEEKAMSTSRKISSSDVAESVEEKAKWLFLRGVQAERLGKLQDAISLYRRAIQLVPDIEFRIEESMDDYFDEYFEESADERISSTWFGYCRMRFIQFNTSLILSVQGIQLADARVGWVVNIFVYLCATSDLEENSSGSDDETDNLVYKFQKIAAKADMFRICQPKHDQKTSHISLLPPEIFLYVLKWVITQDLDVVSLERIAKVCRGFYLSARDPEIWRLICLRIWDMNVDTPIRYGCWRNMFIQRPHLSFNGVYISKTTYIRYGESSFQDTNYRPCYFVEYYRYLRFFPDGVVLMLTTPDDPYQSLYKLRYKKCKDSNVMSGRYKLVGSTVMAIVKKPKNEVSSQSNYYRFRRQRPANLLENQDQTFHLELEVKNVKKRINHQLTWSRYSFHVVYRNGQETVSNFDIVPSNFPSFWFSRVKSYTAESDSPLT